MVTFSMTLTYPLSDSQGHDIFEVEYFNKDTDKMKKDKVIANRKPHPTYPMVPLSMTLIGS